MSRKQQSGLTLVELIISIAIVSIIAASSAALMSVSLRAHSYGLARSSLNQEGLIAMERMTSGVRSCTSLLIPNAHTTSRNILAFSGTVNNDSDFYFGDTLFPRIDEDPAADGNNDNAAGIDSYDDDGDTSTDEGGMTDNDEDGTAGEDAWNGLDDDADGNIDEDCNADVNGDGFAGIEAMDDDGDGSTDESGASDDDEDGTVNEDPLDPILYEFDAGTNTLREVFPAGGTPPGTGETTDLSTNVTAFVVQYEAEDSTHYPRVSITLTLTDAEGNSITFSEYAYPRNIVQQCGKRVR